MNYTTTLATTTATLERAFPFTVDKFPLSGPDGMKTDYYGLFRSDGKQVGGGSVSAKYLPHTLDDVATLVESSRNMFPGDPDAEFTLHCGWRDAHCVTLSPSNDFRREVFDNDSIFPRLVIKAGYDGRAFSASLGMYRDVCRNLSIPEQVKGINARFRHTGSLRGNLDELNQTFRNLSGGWDALVNHAKQMEDKRVNIAHILNEVYGSPKDDDTTRTKASHRRRTEAIVTRLLKERDQLHRPSFSPGVASGWEMFNAVQGYEQHDKNRRKGTTTFDRAMIALSAAPVSAVERLVLMAA